MASASRGQTPPLIDLLAREPHRFDPRQAVRVLEAQRPPEPVCRVPEGQRPPDPVWAVRFRSSLSLAFPIGDIESVRWPGDLRPPVVTVGFLGLGGATGPLPAPFTEHIAAAARRREFAGRDFLDIFNHRLVTAAMDLARLFRPALQRGFPQDSNLARQSFALMGLGTQGMRAALEPHAAALLPLAALVSQRPLSAHAIERAVTAHFGIRARVVPFRGDWLRVPPGQRSVLGRGGRNRRLGLDAMLGGRIWDQSAGILLELGPMPLVQAERLFPASASRHRDLVALLDFLVEGAVAIELRLLVTEDSIGRSELSGTSRLGRNSWLTRRAGARHGESAPSRAGRGRDSAPAEPGTAAAAATRIVMLPCSPVPEPT
jgi:type VI secretion system protein ImpH